MNKLSLWIRIPVTAIAVSVLTAQVVSIFGWFRGWDIIQLSNGLFILGVIAIMIAIILSFNKKNTLTDNNNSQSQTEKNESRGSGVRLWAGDMFRGFNAFLLAALIGVLLIGLSILVGSILD